METSASFEAWSAPSPYPTTARKQAAKIQLRKLAYCDADAVNKAEGSIRTTDNARLRRGRRSH